MKFEFLKPKSQFKESYAIEKTELPYVFRLENGKIYVSIHFDGEKFKHPEDKIEINPEDFISELKERFGASEIVLSCCYPDKAREIIGGIEGVEIIGSGDLEYRTVLNSRKNTIMVESCDSE